MEPTPPAEERILRAALQRFAVDGLSAPLRAVAQDAGVSAGLIIHHYGSRERLLEACDRQALEVTHENKLDAFTGGSGVMLAQLAETERYAPVVGYVLRRLQAGGPLAQQLVADFVVDATDYFEQGVHAGLISPSRDPVARARVLTEMALGALLLQLPAQRDHLDLADLPTWLRSYTDSLMLPMLELFTTPLLQDSSLLDAYRTAAASGDHTPTTTEGNTS
ncbi:TetR family transcriptional regulator [Brachybacterium sp. AOP42-C2-15]|uniref:TetR family transcriptional regulator n=1 Tax=unclassified Brachybacterium TaxID=2623841 RepID=UPI004033D2C1